MTDHPPSDHTVLRARALQAADQLDYAASLIRDLVAELRVADDKIDAMGAAAAGRFEEVLARMPVPFRQLLDRAMGQARENRTVTIDVDESLRALEGDDGT
jgi:hypothetical protein